MLSETAEMVQAKKKKKKKKKKSVNDENKFFFYFFKIDFKICFFSSWTQLISLKLQWLSDLNGP